VGVPSGEDGVDQRTVNATARGLYAKNQVKGTR
jgi:hypothetical protein